MLRTVIYQLFREHQLCARVLLHYVWELQIKKTRPLPSSSIQSSSVTLCERTLPKEARIFSLKGAQRRCRENFTSDLQSKKGVSKQRRKGTYLAEKTALASVWDRENMLRRVVGSFQRISCDGGESIGRSCGFLPVGTCITSGTLSKYRCLSPTTNLLS